MFKNTFFIFFCLFTHSYSSGSGKRPGEDLKGSEAKRVCLHVLPTYYVPPDHKSSDGSEEVDILGPDNAPVAFGFPASSEVPLRQLPIGNPEGAISLPFLLLSCNHCVFYDLSNKRPLKHLADHKCNKPNSSCGKATKRCSFKITCQKKGSYWILCPFCGQSLCNKPQSYVMHFSMYCREGLKTIKEQHDGAKLDPTFQSTSDFVTIVEIF